MMPVISFRSKDPSAMPRPTSQDLAGFWDLLQLSIDDVTAKFDELQQIKSNQWQLVESPEKKVNTITSFVIGIKCRPSPFEKTCLFIKLTFYQLVFMLGKPFITVV